MTTIQLQLYTTQLGTALYVPLLRRRQLTWMKN